LELAGVLRQWEQARPIPIIFLTAETRPEIECTVLETGIDQFMTKPLERGRFLAVVNGLVKRSRQLHNIADVDPLTRLLNRRSFGERLDQEIERSRREFRPLAYATLDLDNFKTINDENGHLVGDEVLRQFALLMRNQMRQSDILGRTGGEEFAIALPGATSTQAQIGLERLRETTEKVLFGQNPTIDVSFSYGIAMWNESSTAKSLYARADAELYRAKRAGKNRGFVSETEDSFRET
jgi:diguanylate cyclase (GGDEF)-like protein